MHEYYQKRFRINSADADLYDYCRPSAILGFFQEMAVDHGALQQIDRDYLVENYNACWLLARVWYHLDRPLKAGEEIRIVTWHRGAGGLIVYRDYDIYSEDTRIGEGTAAWVIADIDNRKMLRPGNIENIVASRPPREVKDIQLRLIRTPKERKHIYDRTIRYSDLDINGHMNNTKYADVAMDALTAEEIGKRFVSELQLNYSLECKEGDTMEISRLLQEDSCYIDGCSADGTRRFETTLQFQPIS